MIDLIKFIQACEKLDPRLNPIPFDTPLPAEQIWKRRYFAIEILLSIATDPLLRWKVRDVMDELGDWRRDNAGIFTK